MNDPCKGQRWDSVKTQSTCRVMADPIEGWVLARYKGAMPFVVHVNEWHKLFTLKDQEKKRSRR